MKKLLLLLAAGTLSAAAVNAQTRLALYEEFSGENCAPCASANPGLNTLLNANTSKVILIKYQSPIPSAGPIYNAYKTVTDARLTYYSVPFAPYGRLDGTGLGTGTAAPSSPGHVANLTQTDINNDAAMTSPFNITVTHAWSGSVGDSVTATVNITAVSAFAPAGANLKLRIAVIEHLTYTNAPGTNGEKDFHNVVREMVPDANGTQLPNSWTASQTQSYTIKGKLPAFVDKSNNEVRLVAWIQNDGDKSIPQAAQSTYVPLTVDGASTGITAPGLQCAAGGNATAASTVTLKNGGTTTLTSAKIYYRVDNGTNAVYSWTGSLAAGATTPVTLPAIAITTGGHVIYDSVASPNGGADINVGNNKSGAYSHVYNSTGTALPISADFETAGAVPANWVTYDANGNGANFYVVKANTGTLGHKGSNYAIYHNNYNYPANEANYAIIPAATIPAGAKALNFYVAYCQYKSALTDDKLEVVYSTNCGTSWTSIWSAAGAALASRLATDSNFLPKSDLEWAGKSIDATSVPAGAMVAFRATSQYGNNLYIDDVTFRTGPLAVGNVITNSQVTLYPNPAKESASLDFNLSKGGKVVVNVLDAVGRTVAVAADATMQLGAQHIKVATANLAAGVYNIAIQTEEGTITQRLSVVK